MMKETTDLLAAATWAVLPQPNLITVSDPAGRSQRWLVISARSYDPAAERAAAA